MKRTITRARGWLGVPEGVEGFKGERAAFFWLLFEKGDLLTVKVGKEDITLKLEFSEGGRPMWYESAPIEQTTADSLVGFPVPGDAYTLCIGGGGVQVNTYNKDKSRLGGFPVQPEKVKVL